MDLILKVFQGKVFQGVNSCIQGLRNIMFMSIPSVPFIVMITHNCIDMNEVLWVFKLCADKLLATTIMVRRLILCQLHAEH